MNDDERLAQDWLKARGYDAEFEPRISPAGRSPDFLATGTADATPSTIWAEVKSIDPENTSVAMAKALPELKSFAVPDNLKGDAFLHVNETTRPQSVRALLKKFLAEVANHAAERTCLMFIQPRSDQRETLYVEVHGEVRQHVWVRGVGQGRVGHPPGTINDLRSSVVTLDSQGKSKTKLAFEAFDEMQPYDCALVVHLDPSDRPLGSINSITGGSRSGAVRAFKALKDANSQLRKAWAFKPAPGLVIIVPQESHFDIA